MLVAGESRVSRPPAARQRKLLTCALRGCRHRSRCSAASTTGRGSSFTSLRVAAPQTSSGALEAPCVQLRRYHQTCNSKLIRARRGVGSRFQVRAAPSRHFYFFSLWCRAVACRKLLPRMQITDDALRRWSCSWDQWTIRERCVRDCPWFMCPACLVRD